MPRTATTTSTSKAASSRSTKGRARSSQSSLPPLKAHQLASVELGRGKEALFDVSDPGTGKTLVQLALWAEHRRNGGGKLLVVCPKSIMVSAWVEDLVKFFKYEFIPAVATAENRLQAFQAPSDLVITNTDAVTWLIQNIKLLKDFDTIVIDESDAFRHLDSKRTKALLKLAKYFRYRRCLTGTPFDGSILEIWPQAAFLDGGKRLGQSFYAFRNAVATPIQVTSVARKWADKPGAEEAVAGLLQDITIRHRFEDCVDIPPNSIQTMYVDLSPKHMALYQELKEEALLQLERGEVKGVNAAVLAGKLLQLTAGTVYGSTGAQLIDSDRYELVTELVAARQHSVVFYNWDHQLTELQRLAERRGLSHAAINGNTPDRHRAGIVEAFQAGHHRVLFLQPQSAAHGLTLTRGRTTIWTSPVYRAALAKQGMHRIYRTGQTQKTETIYICARGTLEERVYRLLDAKASKTANLLEILS